MLSQSAISAADKVISMNSEGEIARNMKSIAEEMNAVLFVDHAALEKADWLLDIKQLTLSEIVEGGRTLAVDAGSKQLSSVTGAISNRIPIKLRGTGIDGFFTPNNKVGYRPKVVEICKEFAKKYPELAGVFKNLEDADVNRLIMISNEDLHNLYSFNLPQEITGSKKEITNSIKASLKEKFFYII